MNNWSHFTTNYDLVFNSINIVRRSVNNCTHTHNCTLHTACCWSHCCPWISHERSEEDVCWSSAAEVVTIQRSHQ